MNFIKGMFFPDYQTGYGVDILSTPKFCVSFGRLNYEFGNGPQSYFWAEFQWFWNGKHYGGEWKLDVKLSKRNINKYILTRKYGRSTDN